MNERQQRLKKLQAANFAAYDMLLYLDTHADDRRAFEIFRSLVRKTERLKSEYEKDYGPLTAFSSAYGSSFDWLKNPWPWDRAANA